MVYKIYPSVCPTRNSPSSRIIPTATMPIALRPTMSLSLMTSVLSFTARGLTATCDEMVAFLIAQKKANPELLNYHEVIRGQSYQKLRFDIDAPIEFLKHVLSDIKKPEPTGLDFIDSLEFVNSDISVRVIFAKSHLSGI